MENNQNFQPSIQHSFEPDFTDAQDGGLYFTVTYLDTDCDRIGTESFDDAGAADRFASRCVADQNGWAVVDAIPANERRAAA